MGHDTAKRVGLALLCGAVAVRMLASTGVEAAAAQALTGAFDLSRFAAVTAAIALSGPLPEAEPAEARTWVVHILPSEPPASAPEAASPEPSDLETPAAETPSPELTFTAGEAETITIAGKCTYSPDKSALLTRPLDLPPAGDGPQVLIVHTHTSEAYTQTAGWTYTESDPLRTTQADRSVVRVGAEVAAALEARGISVLHDTAYHDYPDYNGAYDRCGSRTAALLAENPSIRVVLDLHRDALVDSSGLPLHRTVTLSDGSTAAPVMLVVGTDQGGMRHPGWEQNLSFALKLQALLTRQEPDLCRDLDLRTERFNQHLSPAALLVEMGATGNTLPEALASARLLGDSLADLLLSAG